MYIIANGTLLLSLFISLLCASVSLVHLWKGEGGIPRFVREGNFVVSASLVFSSLALLYALSTKEYSLDYVASYTDNALELFYRLTAFWAGQPGSMLFWAVTVALMGTLFSFTKNYRELPAKTTVWFWTLFSTVTAFFSLILLVWNNPFISITPVPFDGKGLNPLLQNPGMIIHPPLLFLGYAGFTVPACLALAQAASGRGEGEKAWHELSRSWLIIAWSFLTAGIALGAWWAYMELGWGGYWAWDPVENASLIPWLIATATFHTLAIERHRNKLSRTNTFFIALTTLSGLFATYLVRSGVVDSVHAFGQNAVGTPLLVFVLGGLLLAFVLSCVAKPGQAPLSSPISREGSLVFTAWILIALACIILVATLWPVVSKIWTSSPQGLDAHFYNRVCLPLGTILVFLLIACPLLGWEGSLRSKKIAFSALALLIASGIAIALLGYTKTLPLIASSCSIAALSVGLILIIMRILKKGAELHISALGTHMGLLLCALAIAFSGAYKTDEDIVLLPGQSTEVAGYTVRLASLKEGRAIDYRFLQANLDILKDGTLLGTIAPEKRIYDKFAGMSFTEVDILPSLGKEVYGSLSGMDDESAVLKISIEPMVNWLWIGCTCMTLFPLIIFVRRIRKSALSLGKQIKAESILADPPQKPTKKRGKSERGKSV